MKRFLLVAVGLLALTATAGADARSNMSAIVDSLEAVGFEWEPWGNDVCARDDLCAILAGHIEIQAIGQSVDVFPTTQEPTDVYLLACSAVLSALTGHEMDAAMSSVALGMVQAASGRAVQDFGGYRFTISGQPGDDLECGFTTP